jgi:hypothetical protein
MVTLLDMKSDILIIIFLKLRNVCFFLEHISFYGAWVHAGKLASI